MQKPNILFIMTDDHAAHAMSCYGSKINKTPNLDRIAEDGMRFDNCYVTNSICTPSRAAILTGTHNHVNRVTTLSSKLDNRLPNLAKHLKTGGYQTCIIGKWHLGIEEASVPSGFDHWCVLPGQGDYHNPKMLEMGEMKKFNGYATDIITDKSMDWLENRDKDKPFFLMCHHKAPHRPWEPDEKHAHMYEDEDIRVPDSFDDDYKNRAKAAAVAKMRMTDLTETDLKATPPEGLTQEEEKHWRYQRYIKDYLRCVASVDDNVGRILDYLDENGLTENTIVVYTSDQGFFLGDHGWFDKRFMYEESMQMPFVIRYPEKIKADSVCREIICNVDFAPTFLDMAGLTIPSYMQGYSFTPLLAGEIPDDWQQSAYHRYWMNEDSCHNVYAHYGIRTKEHKLIYYYNEDCGEPGANPNSGDQPEWELFDLKKDPLELFNEYKNPEYKNIVKHLTAQLEQKMAQIGDTPMH